MDKVANNSSLVTAIDIGSSKISVVVAELVGNRGKYKIIGIGKVPSAGIKVGSVSDQQLLVKAIREAVTEAENTSGRKIDHVTAAITGKYLRSVNKVGRVVLRDGVITESEARRALELAKRFDPKKEGTDPRDEVVTHHVKGFTIDNDATIKENPIDMQGNVLMAHVHLAIGQSSIAMNLTQCVKQCGLMLDMTVLPAWASASSALTKTEKELGVILLDMGASTIDIACYKGGHIEYTAVMQFGGDRLTHDIAACFGMSIADAEEVKRKYLHLEPREQDRFEKIVFTRDADKTRAEIKTSLLLEVGIARVDGLLQGLKTSYLQPDNWCSRATCGVVITGGMANLPGICEAVERNIGLKTRIAAPGKIAEGDFQLSSPEDATVLGALKEAVRHRTFGQRKVRTANLMNRTVDFFKRALLGDY